MLIFGIKIENQLTNIDKNKVSRRISIKISIIIEGIQFFMPDRTPDTADVLVGLSGVMSGLKKLSGISSRKLFWYWWAT